MPFYFDRDADGVTLSLTMLQDVNAELRRPRRNANPDNLHGASRVWFGRILRLERAIQELPLHLNCFRLLDGRRTMSEDFAIRRLLRVEPPFVRASVTLLDSNVEKEISIQIASLEEAVESHVDAAELHRLRLYKEAPASSWINLTEATTRQILRQHGPCLRV